MSFVRTLWELHRLYELEPRQDLLAQGTIEQIRCAATPDATRIAIYVPYARDVQVTIDLTGYDVVATNLAACRFERPLVTRANETSIIGMTQSNGDVLIVATKI